MEDKNIFVPPGGERMRMGRGRAHGCGDEARIQAAAASAPSLTAQLPGGLRQKVQIEG